MAVNLSFIGGAGWQFLDNNGDPLSGGKVYTYAAGTTTPQTTYTARDGLTANSNPIVLDSAGRTPEQIWSTEGLLYKYVIATSDDVVIRVWDNIGGSIVASDLAQNLADPTGASLVGFTGFKGQVGTVADLAAANGSEWLGATNGRSVQEAIDYVGTDIAARKIAAPGGFTVGAGSAGALTGDYTYAVVFRTADGVSSPSPRVGPVAFAAQRGELSNIPVSVSSAVIARDIYRTVANPVDVAKLFFVGSINDNTTTTFTDNVADGALGASISWAETAGGKITVGGSLVANVLGNAVSFGEDTGTGYASTAVGNYALSSCTSGLRNTAYGVYALTSTTTGDQNTAAGVHSGNDLTTGRRNTFYGYGAGFHTVSGDDNVAIGQSAMQEASGATSNNTAVGAYALWLSQQTVGHNTAIGFRAGSENTLGFNCIFLGAYAGRKSNISSLLVVDAYPRASEVDEIDKSIIYGIMDPGGSASVAKLKVNARLLSANSSIFNLPDAANAGWYLNEAGSQIFSTGASAENVTAFAFYNGGALVGAINVSGGTTTSYLNLSDARAKENIAAAPDAQSVVDAINVRSFDWKTSKEHISHGLIAQELAEVFPSAVSQGSDDSPWMVDSAKLVPLLIKAVQELSARVELLESRSN